MTNTAQEIPNVAKVAYEMAKNIWYASNKGDPTITDEEFMKLVSTCSIALQGKFGAMSYKANPH